MPAWLGVNLSLTVVASGASRSRNLFGKMLGHLQSAKDRRKSLLIRCTTGICSELRGDPNEQMIQYT